VVGTVIAVVAYFLGHLHKGRAFAKNIHAGFSNWLMLMLGVQIVFGIYLKFHITKGFHGKIRKVAVVGHGIVGKLMPVVAWVQMLFGGITALGTAGTTILDNALPISSWEVLLSDTALFLQSSCLSGRLG
jgi:hypothetical protein